MEIRNVHKILVRTLLKRVIGVCERMMLTSSMLCNGLLVWNLDVKEKNGIHPLPSVTFILFSAIELLRGKLLWKYDKQTAGGRVFQKLRWSRHTLFYET
jgi:hypothetical protein